MGFADVDALEEALARESYLADRGLAVAVYLALTLRRPLLLEGEPGVGKTEIARTLARVLDARLIRLQCYEGIDAGQALYEWDYSRQLLYARTLQDGALDPSNRASELYGPEFLVERPLLQAVREGAGAVLLVISTDAGIATDMPMWCKATRNEHLGTFRDGPAWKSWVRKRAPGSAR